MNDKIERAFLFCVRSFYGLLEGDERAAYEALAQSDDLFKEDYAKKEGIMHIETETPWLLPRNGRAVQVGETWQVESDVVEVIRPAESGDWWVRSHYVGGTPEYAADDASFLYFAPPPVEGQERDDDEEHVMPARGRGRWHGSA